jgi:hypothetical protein
VLTIGYDMNLVCQIFSTPLHLTGLDIYNRHGEGIRSRWNAVRVNWVPSALARMCRIIPAFVEQITPPDFDIQTDNANL